MTFRLLDRLAGLPDAQTLFCREDGGWITAGQVRAGARGSAEQLAGGSEPVMIYTSSLGCFAAALLAAGLSGRNVVLPAHDGEAYLDALGDDLPLITDGPSGRAGSLPIELLADLTQSQDIIDASVDDPDLTFYTSGSTGAPKAVHKAIRQLDTEAAILRSLWTVAPDTNVVSTVSHQHIYGLLFRLFWPMANGCTSDDRMSDYWETVQARADRGASVVVSSPAHLDRIPDGIACGPELVFSSGAPLGASAAAAAAQTLGSWPREVLGSTETGGVGWRTQQGGNSDWQALPEVQISLSEEGEIQVQSPHADGDTACTLGDKGALLGSGRFRITGRSGPVVKVEGVRVSLVRVEEHLCADANVAAARVLFNARTRNRLAAVVVLNDAGRARLAEIGAFRLGRHLRKALAADLAPAERPKLWRFVDALPMNAQGKVTMNDLTALFDDQALALTDIDADETEASARLRLDAGMTWFQGHFPGQPVLPGMAQVHLAWLAADQIWNWRPVGTNLMKTKFKRVTRPGEALALHLTRDLEKQCLWFRLEADGEVTASGRIGGRG